MLLLAARVVVVVPFIKRSVQTSRLHLRQKSLLSRTLRILNQMRRWPRWSPYFWNLMAKIVACQTNNSSPYESYFSAVSCVCLLKASSAI